MENQEKGIKKYLPGIFCLIIVVGIFGGIGSVMGTANMLNTIMNNAHDLLLNTVFYLMAICVITGAIGKGGTGQLLESINTFGQFLAGGATAGSVTGFLHAGEQFALSNTPVTGIQEKFNGNVVAGMNSGSAGGGIASMFLSGNLGKADFRGFCFIPKGGGDLYLNVWMTLR